MPQQQVSTRKIAWGGTVALRILLVLAAFAVLYGCAQGSSSPVEKQEKGAGVEEAKPKEPKEPTEQAAV
jgi:hypothetical protein